MRDYSNQYYADQDYHNFDDQSGHKKDALEPEWIALLNFIIKERAWFQ